MNEIAASSIHFAPLVPMLWIWMLGGSVLLLSVLSLWRFRGGVVLRFLMGVFLILLLLNPSLLEEVRKPTKDVAVVVVDRSMSQNFGARTTRTEKALASIRRQLQGREDLDLRIVEASDTKNEHGETRLFSALESTLSDIPKARRAGVILLTDGQIHDVPLPENAADFGPVHGLITGIKNEYDRRIVLINAPAYGITGQSIGVSFKVEDSRQKSGELASVIIRNQDGAEEFLHVTIGEEYAMELPIEHAGQNVFEIITAVQKGELTGVNNRNVILVNGVRDRLKVLLVSGKPHVGERTWRNLLTSDPGVDLVHFTILREIRNLDRTPQDELSLIPFPFEELFEVKLYDFDLIIFDNYRLNRILPNKYFENIVRYVREGGALLEASGASYADEKRSTYSTPLKQILPAIPSGGVIEQEFFPQLSEKGKQHPVTRDLVWDGKAQNWGPWFRQTRVTLKSGSVLMSGIQNTPLLLLDRVGKGRVAQFSSDNIWLWAKGYKNGGPHAELSRRIIHWLMKEPELDEKAMSVAVHGNNITIRMQNYEREESHVQMVNPDGHSENIALSDNGTGWFEKKIVATQNGIYSFENAEGVKKFAVIGSLNPPEMRNVLSTETVLKNVVEHSRGKIIWLSKHAEPSIRIMAGGANTRYGGRNWIGLRQNNDYEVTSARDIALFTPWSSVLFLVAFLALIWWFEGRKN